MCHVSIHVLIIGMVILCCLLAVKVIGWGKNCI